MNPDRKMLEAYELCESDEQSRLHRFREWQEETRREAERLQRLAQKGAIDEEEQKQNEDGRIH
jgi:hypothetical protein